MSAPEEAKEIAVRGSGRAGQPSGAAADAGTINYDFYTRLVNAAPQLHFAIDPVRYPADQAGEALSDIVAFHHSESLAATRTLKDTGRTKGLCQESRS